jgi:hypothetical protein
MEGCDKVVEGRKLEESEDYGYRIEENIAAGSSNGRNMGTGSK